MAEKFDKLGDGPTIREELPVLIISIFLLVVGTPLIGYVVYMSVKELIAKFDLFVFMLTFVEVACLLMYVAAGAWKIWHTVKLDHYEERVFFSGP